MGKNSRQTGKKRKAGDGKEKTIVFLSLLAIAAAGFAVYINSLGGEFLWDDEILVKGNPYLKSWSHLPEAFSRDIGAGTGRIYGYYRPLQTVSYMADYSVWKLDPRGYHLTSVLLHLLAAVLLYWWLRLLFSDRLLAFFAGMLFAVHPMQTEAVAFISGRSDPLALVFVILGFVFYQKAGSEKRPVFSVPALACWAAALLSRESSLILPFLVLLYHSVFRRPLRGRGFPILILIALILTAFRMTFLRQFLPHTTSSTTAWQRLPGFFAALSGYLRILFVPMPLHMEYGDRLFAFSDPRVIAGAGIFLLLAVAFFRARRDRLVLFSLGWIALTLLPVSNLYPVGAYMAEHWLYLPSVGIFLLAAGFFRRLCRQELLKTIAPVLIGVLLIFYSGLTIRQNRYWRTKLGFFERTLVYAPESVRVLNNLGLVYHSLNRYAEAAALYEKAVKIRPGYYEAHNNLGCSFRELGQREEAIAEFKRTLELKPGYATAYYNLGTVYFSLGRKEEAIASFRKAIALNPNYALAYNDLAIVYSFAGQAGEAIGLFRKSIALDPDYAGAYNNLGSALNQSGKPEEALGMFRKAVDLEPGFAEAHYNMGRIYNSLGRREEAIAAFVRTVAIRPEYAAAHNNLAVLYYAKQEFARAVMHADRALALGYPVNPEFLELLKVHRPPTQ